MSAEVINKFTGEHFFLSNFYRIAIKFDGMYYPSVEHAFQAAKCVDPADRETIRNAPTCGKAKRLGRAARLRPDWEILFVCASPASMQDPDWPTAFHTQAAPFKVLVMESLLYKKFAKENQDLRKYLGNTGEATLIEGNDWGDNFWGVCGMNGQNWLGRLLMNVRTNIRLGKW